MPCTWKRHAPLPLKRLTAHAAAHASSTVRELLTARLLETGEMVPTPVPVQTGVKDIYLL